MYMAYSKFAASKWAPRFVSLSTCQTDVLGFVHLHKLWEQVPLSSQHDLVHFRAPVTLLRSHVAYTSSFRSPCSAKRPRH